MAPSARAASTLELLLNEPHMFVGLIVAAGVIALEFAGAIGFHVLPEGATTGFFLAFLVLVVVYQIKEFSSSREREEASASREQRFQETLESLAVEVGSLTYTPTMNRNYRAAIDLVSAADEARSTYFVPYPTDDELDDIDNPKARYFKLVQARIVDPSFRLRRIVRVDDQDELEGLLRHDIRLHAQHPDVLRSENSEIRLVPTEVKYPLLNFLVAEVQVPNENRSNRLALIAISSGKGIVNDGALIRETKLAGSLEDMFDDMWEDSIPLVDDGRIHLEVLYNLAERLSADLPGGDARKWVDDLIGEYRPAPQIA